MNSLCRLLLGNIIALRYHRAAGSFHGAGISGDSSVLAIFATEFDRPRCAMSLRQLRTLSLNPCAEL